MNTIPTHIYIDKNIASLEKTMSDNLARMEAIVANNVEANRVANENLKSRLDENNASFKATTAEMREINNDIRRYISNLRIQAISIAVGAVLGLAVLNYALVQNVTASFSLGQSLTGVVKNEAENQISNLLARISQSDSKIDKMNELLNRLISEHTTRSTAKPSP